MKLGKSFRISGITFANGAGTGYQSVCCGVLAEGNVVVSNCVVTTCGGADVRM